MTIALQLLTAVVIERRAALAPIPAEIEPFVINAAYIVPAAELHGLHLALARHLAGYIVTQTGEMADARGYEPAAEYRSVEELIDAGWADGLGRSWITPAEAVIHLADLAWTLTGKDDDRTRALSLGSDAGHTAWGSTQIGMAADPRVFVDGFVRRTLGEA